MNHRQLHRLHKWIAVTAGVFFLSWMVSGIVMILPGGKIERKNLPPQYDTAKVSPAQAAAAVGKPVKDMALIHIAGKLVYEVQTGQDSHLVDAHSGELFPITLDLAEHIVRSEYLRIETALQKERLDRHDWTYRTGPLPVFRLRAAESGEQYYVSAQDGGVRKVTQAGRVRTIIGSMHTLEIIPGISGNPRVQKLALAGAATIGMGAVVTGYWLALNRRRKVQAG